LTGRALLVLAALVLGACASAPKRHPYYADDGPPESVPAGLDRVPDAVPRDEAPSRSANRPYTVLGQTYVPVVGREAYKERGLASWYGRKFQGQKTASGEPYDMFKMTAAHKTLPIPSYARVTNLANGKSVVVRVNDRGPFYSGRVIDLSYAAATRIGLAARGSGMVEVERVFESSPAREGATAPTPAPPSPAPVATAASAIPPAAAAAPALVTADAGGIWVQLGAFSSAQGAEIFRDQAARALPWILEPIRVIEAGALHRVRLGPYRNREEADAIAAKVRESLGYAPAVIDR